MTLETRLYNSPYWERFSRMNISFIKLLISCIQWRLHLRVHCSIHRIYRSLKASFILIKATRWHFCCFPETNFLMDEDERFPWKIDLVGSILLCLGYVSRLSRPFWEEFTIASPTKTTAINIRESQCLATFSNISCMEELFWTWFCAWVERA